MSDECLYFPVYGKRKSNNNTVDEMLVDDLENKLCGLFLTNILWRSDEK